jgi:nitrogenase subunit NifH
LIHGKNNIHNNATKRLKPTCPKATCFLIAGCNPKAPKTIVIVDHKYPPKIIGNATSIEINPELTEVKAIIKVAHPD